MQKSLSKIQQFKSNSVLTVDLDDTLYKEADYVHSGLGHIAELIEKLTGERILDKLVLYYQQNQGKRLFGVCVQGFRFAAYGKRIIAVGIQIASSYDKFK